MRRIITIGRRCTTDSFLSKFKIRSFSGPFSYLICDFKTSLKNLNENFKNYFNNIEEVNNHKLMYLNHWRMTKKYFINNYFSKSLINKNFYDYDKILLWNHHDMKKDKETFKRRIDRINIFLNNEKCILFYIDKIIDEDINEYIKNINYKIKKYYNYEHIILYIIPFTNKEYEKYNCKLFYENKILKIFLLKTTAIKDLENETLKQNKKDTPLLDVDINDKNINWNLLYNNIKCYFN